MNIQRKVKMVNEVLDSLIRHDDAPIEEIDAALEEVREHIREEYDLAVERRAQKALETVDEETE